MTALCAIHNQSSRMETHEEKLVYRIAGEFCLFDTGNTEAKTPGNIQPKIVHDEKKSVKLEILTD